MTQITLSFYVTFLYADMFDKIFVLLFFGKCA